MLLFLLVTISVNHARVVPISIDTHIRSDIALFNNRKLVFFI